MLYYPPSLTGLRAGYRPRKARRAEPPEVVGRAGRALELWEVWRAFGAVVALAPVTLAVDAGAVCLVRGPNGAGKTTLLRLAAGLLRPSGGERRARAPAVYLAAGDGALAAQTVAAAVGFAARLGHGATAGALELCGLEALARQRVGSLSQGERSRLTLAVALAARPALLCLDEPTAHLDDAGVQLAAGVAGALADAGTAVLVATHHPEMFAGVGDALLALRDGHLEAQP